MSGRFWKISWAENGRTDKYHSVEFPCCCRYQFPSFHFDFLFLVSWQRLVFDLITYYVVHWLRLVMISLRFDKNRRIYSIGGFLIHVPCFLCSIFVFSCVVMWISWFFSFIPFLWTLFIDTSNNTTLNGIIEVNLCFFLWSGFCRRDVKNLLLRCVIVVDGIFKYWEQRTFKLRTF